MSEPTNQQGYAIENVTIRFRNWRQYAKEVLSFTGTCGAIEFYNLRHVPSNAKLVVMKLNLAVIVVLCVLALASPEVMATQIQTGSDWGPYQSGNGGEFTVKASGLNLSDYSKLASGYTAGVIGSDGTFQTFCIENSSPYEYIEKNTAYNVAVNTKAVDGGNGGGTNGDPLSKGTGWLYSQFATGTLNDYNFSNTSSRNADAALLQNAIWWLEGEAGLAFDSNNKFMAAVEKEFVSQDAAKADGAWLYNVYALNMTKVTTGGKAQDQLYYRVPDGGLTLAMLGLGLAGVGLVARRRS